MQRDNSGHIVRRRTALKSIGVAGLGALAGCLSGSEREDDHLLISGGPQVGTGYILYQAMATVASENSDIEVEVQPAEGGTVETMRLLDAGDVDIGYMDNYGAILMANDEGAWAENPLKSDVSQAFRLFGNHLGYSAHPDAGIDTVTQLDEDVRLNWGIEGGTVQVYLTEALSHAVDVDDVDAQEVEWGNQATQLDTGNIDVASEVRQTGGLSPFISELNELIPDKVILEWPEDVVESIGNDARLTGSYREPEYFGEEPDAPGWEGRDELFWLDLNQLVFTRDDVSADLIETFFTTLYENQEELAGQHDILADYYLKTDFEFIANGFIDDYPIHDGSRAFFDTYDLR